MTEPIIHKKDGSEPEYGNWIPVKLVGIFLSLTIVAFIIFILTILYSESCLLKTLTTLLFLAAAFFFGYMTYVRRVFDFRHGGAMGKIHQYVLDCLAWDGKGKLLDVGIRLRRTYHSMRKSLHRSRMHGHRLLGSPMGLRHEDVRA